MRNKLIIEKDKQLIDSLKFKHSYIKDKIEQLHNEKFYIEQKLIENLICPECYSVLNVEKHDEYNYYDCTICWYETHQ